jgi:hypothetical protein
MGLWERVNVVRCPSIYRLPEDDPQMMVVEAQRRIDINKDAADISDVDD